LFSFEPIFIMKKFSLFFVFWAAFTLTNYAAYIEKFPITVTQPDGTEVHCFTTGDEFYNRVHDAEGYTLIRDPHTSIVVYARLENDELVSTGYRVGSINPATIGLKPGIIVSAEKRTQLRNEFLSTMPDHPATKNREESRAGWNNGTINNLVIYIRFSDESEFPAKANTYNNMFNGTATNTSSMYRYFKEASNDATLIPSIFYPAHNGSIITSYQDIHPRSYFQPYNAATNPNGYSGGNGAYDERAIREHALLRRAVEHVRSQIPTSLNLDFNNDGLVDNICFIVRGSPGAWSSLLWPHKWQLHNEYVSINGKRVWIYNLLIETHLDNSGASVLAHEMFHTLGAPDFYRYSDNTINPVGTWDLMASNTNFPQSSTAWVKYRYGGWISSIPEITQSGTYTLNNVWSATDNAYRINSPNSSTEFFIVEYRNTDVFWDSGIPGSGLIIYRVNQSLGGNANGPPDELYVFRPDGTNNITDGVIYSAHFSSQVGRTAFNNTSNPPCFLSNNLPANIHIRNIGASGGATMSFEVLMNVHSIDATASVGGTISPAGSIPVETGDNVTFTFAPNLGYRLSQVLINGINNTAAVAAGSYTFTNVTTNQTIAVSFTGISSVLTSIMVNGSPINSTNNMTYMAACEGEEYIDLELVSEGAIKVNNNPYTGRTTIPLVFSNDKAIININIDGVPPRLYTLSVSKALGGSSPRMYVQRWGKTLAVINNPDNNGGHSFSNYQWYHNNEIMHGSTGGYILLGDFPAHEYSAEANSNKTYLWHKICPNDSYETRTEIAVYPNPVGAGQLLNLSLPDGIDKVNIRIYNLSGNLVRLQDGVAHTVTMPNQTGVYIVEIQLPNGTKDIHQVVVN